jgi:hypothetical protein
VAANYPKKSMQLAVCIAFSFSNFNKNPEIKEKYRGIKNATVSAV